MNHGNHPGEIGPGNPSPAPCRMGFAYLLSFIFLTGIVHPQPRRAGNEPSAWIRLRSQTVPVTQAEPRVLGLPQAGFRDPSPVYALVKFPGPLDSQQVRALRDLTERIFAYLPEYAFAVKVRREKLRDLRRSAGASWVGWIRPEYKIAPEIQAVPPSTSNRSWILTLLVDPDANLNRVIHHIRSLGIRSILGYGRGLDFSRIRLRINTSTLLRHRTELARLPEVIWIGEEGRKRIFPRFPGKDAVAPGISRGDRLYARGVTGRGQRIAIFDTGVDPGRFGLIDQNPALRPSIHRCDRGASVNDRADTILAVDFLDPGECIGSLPEDWDPTGHGTHTAEILAADAGVPGKREPGDGVTPEAHLIIQDAGHLPDPCSDLPGIGCPVVDFTPILRQAYEQGARILAQSWVETTPIYSSTDADIDRFVWNHPDVLPVLPMGYSTALSATNEQFPWAKNALLVSAPDASGCGSDGENCLGEVPPPFYPAAAGWAAMVRQYFQEGWYPTGTPNPSDGFNPSAALIRAVLFHAAETGVHRLSTSVEPPALTKTPALDKVFQEGAGFSRLFITDDPGFPAGSRDVRNYRFTVTNSDTPLRATLAWTDYPATPAAAEPWVNDLDLIIIGPDGRTTFYGHRQPHGRMPAADHPERRSNLEQIVIPSPEPGVYTVQVRAYNIAFGPQPFALVITGAFQPHGPFASYVSHTIQDSCSGGGPGDADGYVDPGESIMMPVTLMNTGDVDLTNISGTLSTSSTGVTLTDTTAAWPDLTVGASASSLPNHFSYTPSTSFTCGFDIDFSLNVSYDQGSNPTSFLVPVGSVTATLLNEDFSSGIPSTWTIQTAGSCSDPWTDTNPCSRSIPPPFDSAFAIVDSDCQGCGHGVLDERLITPSMDASSCSNVVLKFSNQFRWYYMPPDEIGDVDVSTDGGTTWTNVLSIQGGNDGYPTPNTKYVDLTPYAAGQADVKIRFRYYQAVWEYWWAIDNVQVFCPLCHVCAGGPGEVDVLTVKKQNNGADLRFDWTLPSGCSPTDYALYKGDLTSFDSGQYSHNTQLTCTTGGDQFFTLPMNDSRIGNSDYYLVTSLNNTYEGSYGRRADSGGTTERPPSTNACKPQSLGPC